LADQLLLPMAFLAGGEFRTLKPSRHLVTNKDVINTFLPGCIKLEELDRESWKASCTAVGE
jgi:RNA 3'-terminal phosphate cyclase